MNALILRNPLHVSLIPVIGCFLGILVAFDPLLTIIVVSSDILTIRGTNMLALFPYEITSVILLFPVLLFFIGQVLSKMAVHFEKAALIAIIVSSQTVALHRLGFLDGADLIVGMVFVMYLFKKMFKKEKMYLSFLVLLDIFLFCFIILAAINGRWFSLITGLICVKFTLLSFILTNILYENKLGRFFIKWLIIMTTVSSVIAILQELLYMATGIAAIGLVDPNSRKYMFEMTSLGDMLRAPALTSNYKMFAFYLTTCIILLINYVFYAQPKKNRMKKYIYISVALFLMSVALLLTFSVDSMLALIEVVLLSIFFKWRRYAIHFFVVAVLLVLFVYFAGLMDDIYNLMLTQISWGEYRIRMQLNRDGIYGFLNQYTFLGGGFKSGAQYTNSYWTWPSHNAIILAADEVGLLGLIAYIIPICYTLVIAVTVDVSAIKGTDKAIARGLLFSMVCLLIILQTHAGWIENVPWLYMALIQSFALIILNGKEREIDYKAKSIS